MLRAVTTLRKTRLDDAPRYNFGLDGRLL
uniref:Uncharacterized protein n=1 Tax=Rhizophora mucronata TaxID=61149 RepID=A0A2P2P4P7_RHIMU